MTRVSLAAVGLGLVLAAAPFASAKARPLSGSVGPGFTISLKTPAGVKVKSLKAGSYAITVTDKSSSHDFHLIGPGVNTRITKVDFTGKKTVVVALRPGKYRYQCDPHKDFMKGSFVVTK